MGQISVMVPEGLQDEANATGPWNFLQGFQEQTFYLESASYNGPVESEGWMMVCKILLGVLILAAMAQVTGCGSDCGANGLQVSPATATVNHTAAPPGNSQAFGTGFTFKNSSGCPAITSVLVNSNWTVSDPSVHLSAMQGTTVMATCTAAVASPVTITAHQIGGQQFTGTASLICQ